jgi:hypothetical protein
MMRASMNVACFAARGLVPTAAPRAAVRAMSARTDEVGISALGITAPTTIHHNLPYDDLYAHEQKNQEGAVLKAEYGDTFAVDTGKFTGRSPSDKWFVKNLGSESDANLWWGAVNQPTTPEVFDELYEIATKRFNGLDECYVFDGCVLLLLFLRPALLPRPYCSSPAPALRYCGANPKSQKKVRFVHELAWQQHFVTNMFIRPETREVRGVYAAAAAAAAAASATTTPASAALAPAPPLPLLLTLLTLLTPRPLSGDRRFQRLRARLHHHQRVLRGDGALGEAGPQQRERRGL